MLKRDDSFVVDSMVVLGDISLDEGDDDKLRNHEETLRDDLQGYQLLIIVTDLKCDYSLMTISDYSAPTTNAQ